MIGANDFTQSRRGGASRCSRGFALCTIMYLSFTTFINVTIGPMGLFGILLPLRGEYLCQHSAENYSRAAASASGGHSVIKTFWKMHKFVATSSNILMVQK